MPLLEALNGYKLKLPSEVEEEEEEEEEEDSPTAEGEEEEQGEEEEGGRLANGAVVGVTTSLR